MRKDNFRIVGAFALFMGFLMTACGRPAIFRGIIISGTYQPAVGSLTDGKSILGKFDAQICIENTSDKPITLSRNGAQMYFVTYGFLSRLRARSKMPPELEAAFPVTIPANQEVRIDWRLSTYSSQQDFIIELPVASDLEPKKGLELRLKFRKSPKPKEYPKKIGPKR